MESWRIASTILRFVSFSTGLAKAPTVIALCAMTPPSRRRSFFEMDKTVAKSISAMVDDNLRLIRQTIATTLS